MASANDGANLLAEYFGGGTIADGVAAMNAQVEELGLAHTHFANPHGMLLIKAIQMKQQGKSLSSLLDGLREPVESTEIRLPVTCEDFAAAARQIIEYVLDYASSHEGWHVAPDNREGVRISFDIDGELNSAWFLLRLSVHDPVMPLNAESDVPGGVRAVLGKLYEALKDQQGVAVMAGV